MDQKPSNLLKALNTILITVIIFFTFVVRLNAQCGDVILGGYHLEGDYRNLDDRNNYYGEAPLNDDRWKIFRFEAEHDGQATCADVFVWSLVGDDHANDELWVAIYEDTGIQEPDPYGGYAYRVGDLKVWGSLSGDIWAPGQYRHYIVPLTHVGTNRDIIAGQNYWITVQSSDGADIHISRGRTRLPDCASADKRGTEYPRTGITIPPAGSDFNKPGFIYGDNCYEWSIWGSEDSTSTSIVECTEDSDCSNDDLYCTGEEVCGEESSFCEHTGNPCSPDLICDEVTDECKPAMTIQLIPESWYQSRWIPLIVFLRIEGSGTHFDKSVTEITFNPSTTALMLPRVVDEDTISCFGILMTKWMAPVDSIDVTVTTGADEVTETLEIKLLPFILGQGKNRRKKEVSHE